MKLKILVIGFSGCILMSACGTRDYDTKTEEKESTPPGSASTSGSSTPPPPPRSEGGSGVFPLNRASHLVAPSMVNPTMTVGKFVPIDSTREVAQRAAELGRANLGSAENLKMRNVLALPTVVGAATWPVIWWATSPKGWLAGLGAAKAHSVDSHAEGDHSPEEQTHAGAESDQKEHPIRQTTETAKAAMRAGVKGVLAGALMGACAFLLADVATGGAYTALNAALVTGGFIGATGGTLAGRYYPVYQRGRRYFIPIVGGLAGVSAASGTLTWLQYLERRSQQVQTQTDANDED